MKKVIIIIVTCLGLLLLIPVGGFMYINYMLEKSAAEHVPGQVSDVTASISNESDNSTSSETIVENTIDKSSDETIASENNVPESTGAPKTPIQASDSNKPKSKEAAPVESQQPVPTLSQSTDTTKEKSKVAGPTNTAIASTVQQELGQEVAMTDLFSAGFIILKKLSKDEIDFLFGFSNDDYTKEDLEKVRSLLLSKLTADEIKTLRALGQKYGKKLEILDPNLPIR